MKTRKGSGERKSNKLAGAVKEKTKWERPKPRPGRTGIGGVCWEKWGVSEKRNILRLFE